jgi:hypothetical protein
MFSNLAASDNHVGNGSAVAAGRNNRCAKLRHDADIGARKENQANIGVSRPSRVRAHDNSLI